MLEGVRKADRKGRRRRYTLNLKFGGIVEPLNYIVHKNDALTNQQCRRASTLLKKDGTIIVNDLIMLCTCLQIKL